MFFKHDINIFHICIKILNKTNGQTLVEKSTASYIKIRRNYIFFYYQPTNSYLHHLLVVFVVVGASRDDDEG